MDNPHWIWKNNPQEVWIFVCFIFLALLVVINRVIQPSNHNMKLSISVQASSPSRADISDWIRPGIQDILAFIITNLSLALAIVLFKPFDYSMIFSNGFQYLSFLFLCLSALYFSKYCLYILLNHILELGSSGFLYVQQMNWLHYAFSFALSLLLMVWYYQFNEGIQNAIITASMIGISILWMYRLIKLFQLLMANRSFSPFYLILYLCALELMPVLLLMKAWQ